MAIDHTNRLGFAQMPPGYKLFQLDSGHFLFERQVDEADSAIHWDKWQVYRWAWADFKETSNG
ncbi:hypothetical protein FQZ97_664670 [compost metagenome]